VLRRIRDRLVARLAVLIERHRDAVAAELLPRFANTPANLHISLPRTIANAHRMYLGDEIWLGPNSLLLALERYPGTPLRHPDRPGNLQTFEPRLTIGNRVTATAALQISVHLAVTIEDDVLFASNVFISDGTHGYENATEPYKYQPLGHLAPVTIKRGSWIGQNVMILSGVTIGELSIIGANSVVTRSVPPRSIAIGTPARVVKSWDEPSRTWIAAGPPTQRDLR
jgi:acetyltransferase-like isoleucine patch superfamily enzyme